MRHDLQVSIIKELMRQVDEDKNVDAGVQYLMQTSDYVCPEQAEKEWCVLFRNHPQLIGFSSDLPEPGSFFTVDDFGVPVLATRDKNGQFHAFLNACRHRGARVANEPKGKGSVFVCPFHAWTYSLDGDLVGIAKPNHFGEIDKSCNGLISLPAVEKDGLLWVHPQPGGTLDVAALLGPLAEELASFNFDDFVNTGVKTIAMNLNWKLANDTFGETYHFQKLHKNTLAQVYYGHNLAYEEFGRHHRFVTARKTMDAMRDKPESEWKVTDASFVLYYLFPNIQLIVNSGFISLVRIYPDPKNPARSITHVTFYFQQALLKAIETAGEGETITPDNVYDLEARAQSNLPSLAATMEVFTSAIEQEDYLMGEHQQLAAESGLLPETIFGRNEPALHHFHNSFREALGMAPLVRKE